MITSGLGPEAGSGGNPGTGKGLGSQFSFVFTDVPDPTVFNVTRSK